MTYADLQFNFVKISQASCQGILGMWCPSNDVNAFTQCVDKMLASDTAQMGEAGYQFYLNNYTVEHTYNAIMKHFNC